MSAFNPLEKRSLAESVAKAMLARTVESLPPAAEFAGAGIYAIYYMGDFPPYVPIATANRNGRFGKPIYVGKAVPPGARKGGFTLESKPGPVLYRRLKGHSESVTAARNLSLNDFKCRHLVVDDIWIPLAESLLIEMFSPLWNKVIDGFGNHDPGSGRYQGEKSPWDVIHPGRAWAAKCKPNRRSEAEILASVAEFLSRKAKG